MASPLPVLRRAVQGRACSAISRVLILVIAALAFFPAVTWADGPLGETVTPGSELPRVTATARVDSRPDGIYVQISVRESSPGNHEPAPAAAHPSTSAAPPVPAGNRTADAANGTSWTDNFGYHYRGNDGHTQDLTPENISSVSTGFWSGQFASHPNQVPYNLLIDKRYQGFVWLPNSPGSNVYVGPPPPQAPPPQAPPNTPPAGSGSSTDPRQVALDVLTHIPLPDIKLDMNPGLGLVALPGWFWANGYNGGPFGASRTVAIPPVLPGRPPTSFTVTVRVWGDRYQWNFGDGSTLIEGSLGQAYPQQSDVQHTYQFSSFGMSTGFDVLLTVEFAANYQVNGGAPQALPPIQHTYRASYPVQEVQPTLGAPQRP